MPELYQRVLYWVVNVSCVCGRKMGGCRAFMRSSVGTRQALSHYVSKPSTPFPLSSKFGRTHNCLIWAGFETGKSFRGPANFELGNFGYLWLVKIDNEVAQHVRQSDLKSEPGCQPWQCAAHLNRLSRLSRLLKILRRCLTLAAPSHGQAEMLSC